MALIKCPECGKEISSSAVMCPNCGYSISVQTQAKRTVNKHMLIEQSGLNNGQKSFMEKYIDEVDNIYDLKGEYNKMNTIACFCTLFGLLGGLIGWIAFVGSKPKFAGYCFICGLIGTVTAIILAVLLPIVIEIIV